jgi:hypothetical protein
MFLPSSHSFSLAKPGAKPVVRVGIKEFEKRLQPAAAPGSGVKVFMPNAHSFSLARTAALEPAMQAEVQEYAASAPLAPPPPDSGWKIFLPNSHSFSLTWPQEPAARLPTPPLLLENSRSFSLTWPGTVNPGVQVGIQDPSTSLLSPSLPDSGKSSIGDKDKRKFLKIAGIAGASLAASLVLPKKAEAFVLGSSPTTGVVGVKNAANARINPATEETVSTLLKTSDLTFDSGALNVNVSSLPAAGGTSFSDAGDVARSGLVDVDRHVQVDVLSSALPTSASTETTLQTISFGGFKFALRLDTVGSVDYVGEASIGTTTSAASWRIKKIDSTTGIVLQWAGTGVFDQVWDNRASLTYT